MRVLNVMVKRQPGHMGASVTLLFIEVQALPGNTSFPVAQEVVLNRDRGEGAPVTSGGPRGRRGSEGPGHATGVSVEGEEGGWWLLDSRERTAWRGRENTGV